MNEIENKQNTVHTSNTKSRKKQVKTTKPKYILWYLFIGQGNTFKYEVIFVNHVNTSTG